MSRNKKQKLPDDKHQFQLPLMQLISVVEARKLLGKDALNLSDASIGELVSVLSLIASRYFKK